MPICKSCRLEKPDSDFPKRKSESNPRRKCQDCTNKQNRDILNRSKIRAIEYLGGKCTDCKVEYTQRNIAIFDLHHRDKTSKEFEWRALRSRPFEIQKLELDKCELLCANCHRLKHTCD